MPFRKGGVIFLCGDCWRSHPAVVAGDQSLFLFRRIRLWPRRRRLPRRPPRRRPRRRRPPRRRPPRRSKFVASACGGSNKLSFLGQPNEGSLLRARGDGPLFFCSSRKTRLPSPTGAESLPRACLSLARLATRPRQPLSSTLNFGPASRRTILSTLL